MSNPRLSDNDKFKELQNLINKTKQQLETNVLLGNKDVNRLFN